MAEGFSFPNIKVDSLDITPEIPILREIPWLKYTLFGNSFYDYFIATLIFLFLTLMIVSRKLLLAKLTEAADGDSHGPAAFFHGLLLKLSPSVLMLCAFYVASKRLQLAGWLEKTFAVVTTVIVTVQTVRIINQMLTYVILKARAVKGASETGSSLNMGDNIASLARFGVWTAGVLFMLDNLGFNVSTFVAGLGIGGAALALASQAILGDTFSAFAISLDRPFAVGDFIVVDKLSGTVEHIGLKTTRIRSITGELLIFSNSDLTKSRICNFQQMTRRRILFQIGIIYQTSPEIVRLVPKMLRDIVEAQPLTQFERAHFKAYGPSSLDFEVVYFVLSPEYVVYMDTQQAINFAIMDTFQKAGIQFAYPTQTLFLSQESQVPLPPPTSSLV